VTADMAEYEKGQKLTLRVALADLATCDEQAVSQARAQSTNTALRSKNPVLKVRIPIGPLTIGNSSGNF